MSLSVIFHQAGNAIYSSVQATAVQAKNWTAGTFVWTTIGKPLYEKKIIHLTKFDGAVIGSLLCSSAALTYLTWNRFNQAFFPIIISGSLLLGMLSFSYAHYRINKHYDGIAAVHLGQLVAALQAITKTDHQFAPVQAILSDLENKSEFNHLEPYQKYIKEQVKNLFHLCLNPAVTEQNFNDAKATFATYLTKLQRTLIN